MLGSFKQSFSTEFSTEFLNFFFFYIPLKSYKHITDYTTYMIQYPTTKTIPLGAKNYDYLNDKFLN